MAYHRTVPAPSSSTELLALYRDVRAATMRLCEPLEIEDYVPQPITDVSPPKWNIAHTTWFFEEMILRPFAAGYEQFDPAYSFLFNSYYETVGERTRRDERGALARPTVREIFAYREHVDRAMESLLASELKPEVPELVLLGLNHEQQHQELFLTDLKYILGREPLFTPYRSDFAIEESAGPADDRFEAFAAGIYEIGHSGDGFCFDNELARHRVYLHDFEIRKTPVTNGEYLRFIEDSGYRRFDLWHSEGWDWVARERVEAPLYWIRCDGEWWNYTLAGLRPIVPEAPVCHVSFYEAAAFAEWSGRRLPTEFEWEAASGLIDYGLRWEWTNSAYLPYPGYRKAAGAVGEYNGKFMVNQMVLRGASVATPPGHSRASYRNFFHPHLRWQFTGIRLAA